MANKEGELHSIESGTGTPLALVHGFPFDASIWQGQLEALGDVAHILAPDLPGFGQSAPLPEAGGVSMDAYAEALAAWARDKGLEKIVMLGHSMSGYVAFAFARRHADMLAGLILTNTKATPDTEAGKEGRYKLAAEVEKRGPQAVVDAMLPKLFAPGTEERNPQVVARVRGVMLSQQPQGIIAALHAMAARPDSTPDLSNIHVPTLIISGAQDALMPANEAELMHSRIKDAQHIVIEGAGHLPMLENPAAFNSALRGFLGGF